MELVVFVFAAAMILVGGLGVVLRSHPVHAALSLILTLFGVAVIFVSQEAHFLAAVQVIVYAGAIVVLFLFVIMLLGVDRVEELRTEPEEVAAALLNADPKTRRNLMWAMRKNPAGWTVGQTDFATATGTPAIPTLDHANRALIEATLAACDGNVSRAARRLGVSRGLLYRRLGEWRGGH